MADVVPFQSRKPQGLNVGGVLPVRTLEETRQIEQAGAEEQNNRPVIQGLAAHIRQAWEENRKAKDDVEQRMLRSLRQRHGEYDPEKLANIRKQGGSEIYMMLTSVKCRAASSWLRDVMLAQQDGKPWTVDPTPEPDLPPETKQQFIQDMRQQVQQLAAQGQIQSQQQVQEFVEQKYKEMQSNLRQEAGEAAERAERKMEDQLAQGGFDGALSQFIDDLVTFPAAILKGPVVRKRKRFHWGPDSEPIVEESSEPEWERVSPFDIYPSSFAESIQEGNVIERHRLTRGDLYSMIGVEGYSESAIRAVLEEYGRGGLREWLTIDQERGDVEGRDYGQTNPGELIDALQFWGSVQGKLLREWGMDSEQIEDDLADYEIEAWLVGRWVIKAVVNPDPLGRRPYYKACYEEVPGSFWGNAPPDLIRDCQDMCNSAARALSNNMGIASGPQVWLAVDRLPPGEDVTQIYPWKIHQFESDPTGSQAQPMGFFQPDSNANELMGIYEKYALLADEYSGIPKYMTGDSNVGGAGRTASGMSMLMSNAGKAIKQVVSNIDRSVIQPLIDRLYDFNMRYAEDPDLKGDIRVRAMGVSGLMVKESAEVRRNEFLASTANPVDMDIIGKEGRAALLRETAKTLDMEVDKVVPPPEVVRAREAQRQAMEQAAAQAQAGGAQGAPAQGAPAQGAPTQGGQPAQPSMQGQGGPSSNGQQLMDGAPVTDNFQPPSG